MKRLTPDQSRAADGVPIMAFNGFTDIAFNPDKSLNCQARAAALHVALARRGLLDRALAGKDSFLALVGGGTSAAGTPPARRDLFSDVG